ncbi:ACP S-malonyltransferase [Chitinophaga varians]|uniref:[acyl-carrier-protein] S-malonyltransferase n=1 Tax=Chitinophaga varians TaxID=2202339 RepID=A0A847RUH3_9BACT|nr:ACP S-malonyltransferase [Chitinophaga varians]NLR69200.1 ACP S-malonyltransferase [Chitinophaga varians]
MKAVIFPGQGAQYKGMGKDLFRVYRTETDKASEILGYNLEELCLHDPRRQLGSTAFTQPALYVVNALHYYEYEKREIAYFAGHSLGEYNALLAAGAFDFETGLRLVKKRGELMAAASNGGMAAVLGPDVVTLKRKLEEAGYTDIDIANYNTPSQTVIAGRQEQIKNVIKQFEQEGIRIIPLYVSAPFHSRYMKPAADEFGVFLEGFRFSPLQVPVISNVSAKPYTDDDIKSLLTVQIASPVRWMDSIRFLMGRRVTTYDEIGGGILTKMVNEIREKTTPVMEEPLSATAPEQQGGLATRLGNARFRKEYGLKYAYLAGGMYRGIASRELVVRMAKAGMLGFLGTAGMGLHDIEENIKHIQSALNNGEVYGMNLIHNLTDPGLEMETVQLYIKYGVRKIEAAAFMQITRALVYYKLKGIRKEGEDIICDNKILAKLSRPEVAEAFMSPAPEKIVNELLDEGLINAEQAALARRVPMSADICVEADSGGHTDGGIALVLLPAVQELRAVMEKRYHYDCPIHIGLAGGIGAPQAIVCAFMMGADFVLTGSINQCTVEAGTSDTVKDLLMDMNVQDTAYAPAGDMFEIGAQVQVLRKGVLFPARANKLYALYNQFAALEEIPEKTLQQLEKNYFKKPVAGVWDETVAYFRRQGNEAIVTKALQNPKSKMALVFRWYFGYCARLSFEGNRDDLVNYQVHTGPAMGAFNQWVKGTALENWRNRHVDEIGIKLMEAAAQLLQDKLALFAESRHHIKNN